MTRRAFADRPKYNVTLSAKIVLASSVVPLTNKQGLPFGRYGYVSDDPINLTDSLGAFISNGDGCTSRGVTTPRRCATSIATRRGSVEEVII